MIVVSLVTVLILAIERVLWFHHKLRGAYLIVSALENVSVTISCAILVWGFKRLIKIAQFAKDDIVNKVLLFWNSVAYFSIFIAHIVKIFITDSNLYYEV
jgi:hypothetical protein